MGRIYTAECRKCNRIYNFDVGISKIYNISKLLDLNSDLNLLNLFNEKNRKEELRQILERTRIGRKKRAEEGLWYGTGNLPFAYDYDEKKGILVPNKEKAEIVNKMVELYLQGMPMTQVGALFGLQDQTVRSIFTSPVGLGKIPYKDEIFEGQHEPIMTQETYDKLQQKMHEISFYYLMNFVNNDIDDDEFTLIENNKGHKIKLDFKWVDINNLDDFDVRPAFLKRIFNNKLEFNHLIFNELEK